jgi:hypothetical protein
MVALPGIALSQAATASPNAPLTHPRHHKKPVAVPISAPAPPPQPTVAPSLYEQPAVPATVTASGNELTVKADNSSLSQILHQVSTATGMHLDGLSGDERVFGNFGPGAPRAVLTSLLNGTSYNVVMVGDLANGAPRQLLLTRRDAGGTSSQAANAGQNPTHTDEDASDDSGASDDSDDTPPPMQYTPPSIAPATPPPAQGPQRTMPQLRTQGPPPQ